VQFYSTKLDQAIQHPLYSEIPADQSRLPLPCASAEYAQSLSFSTPIHAGDVGVRYLERVLTKALLSHKPWSSTWSPGPARQGCGR